MYVRIGKNKLRAVSLQMDGLVAKVLHVWCYTYAVVSS